MVFTVVRSMKNNKDIRQGRNCVFLMHVHLVFVTKCRRGVFTKEVINDLRAIFSNVCKDFEAELVEFDGENDCVHLLVNYLAVPLRRRLLETRRYPTQPLPQTCHPGQNLRDL